MWTMVLPVQRAEIAKSRLRLRSSGVADAPMQHALLARAIAADSLAAVRECAAVGQRVVVTSDHVTAAHCIGLGDVVLADPGGGLDAAVREGVQEALRADQSAAVAILLPDVPALRPQDLQRALEAASAHRFCLLPDADGTGTVLLCGRPGSQLQPAFGVRSADRHQRLGAVSLRVVLPRLQRDVDTWAALVSAGQLGLGPATLAQLDGQPPRR